MNDIAVLMPIYNGEKHILEQLQSIEAQTLKPAALLIIDDASSDHSLEIVQNFKKSSHLNVSIIENKTNLGINKSLEKLIGICTNSWIAFCDQDDVWEKQKLQMLSTQIQQQNADMIFCNSSVVDHNLNPLGYSFWESLNFQPKKFSSEIDHRQWFFNEILKRNVVAGAASLTRTHMLKSFLPIPDSWIYDYYFVLMTAISWRVVFLDQCLMQYRQHAQNQIGGRKQSFFQRLQASRLKKRDSYQHEASMWQNLKVNNSFSMPISRKIEHLLRRSKMSEYGFIKRTTLTFRELANANYHRFARGWNSFFKDLSGF